MNLTEMKTALEAQQKALADLTTKVSAVEAANATLKADSEAHKASADSAAKAATEAKEESEKLKASIAAIEKRATEAEAKAQKLEAEAKAADLKAAEILAKAGHPPVSADSGKKPEAENLKGKDRAIATWDKEFASRKP